jgi:hypothetical protein
VPSAHAAAIDMFIVATATFRILYTLIALDHDRRKIIHLGVIKNPTQANDKALWVLVRYLMVVAGDGGMSAKNSAAAIGGVPHRERDSPDEQ